MVVPRRISTIAAIHINSDQTNEYECDDGFSIQIIPNPDCR